MPQSINLIPRKEKQEQQKVALIKATTVLAIVLLVAVTGVSFYYFFETKSLKNNIADYDININTSRSKIQALSSVEISARNLDKKYNIVQELFSTRYYYSTLLKEFRDRQPQGIIVRAFDVRDTTINISGIARSYTSVAALVTNLLGDGVDVGIEGLFTEVSISSVALDSSNEDKKFSLSIEFDPQVLVDL